MTISTGGASLEKLAEVLGYERLLIEYLLFKLVSASLVLEANERHFVEPATAEVGTVVAEIRKAEQRRSDAFASIAREWNIPVQQIDLKFLVEHAPNRARGTFSDLQSAFRELAAEIDTITNESDSLVAVACDGMCGILDRINGDSSDPSGRATPEMVDGSDRILR